MIRKLLTENTREVSVKRLSFTDCKDCQLLLMLIGRGRWRQVTRSGKNRGGKYVNWVSYDWETQIREALRCL